MKRPSSLLILLVACWSLAACDFWKSSDQRLESARADFAAGNYRSAMSETKTILEREPEHAQARLFLAELSLWLGDVDSADKEIARALQAGLPASRAAELRYELALTRNSYDDVLAMLKEDRETPQLQRLVVEARARDGLKQYEQERALLDQALKLAPDDPQALLQLARVEAASGEFQKALQLTQRITQPDATKARALT
ncbi:MAG TPA: tetratricopeptide repeat protein, partial [Steroidobacteraceae bacterium]|nr:tetratricopeptide repeat protein [Steroidobacteraceae bacterium]